MSWRINLVINTVVVPTPHLFEDLAATGTAADLGWEREDFREVNALRFDEDHMEHMDYVSAPDVQEVLKKHKVQGSICFTSHEGDNKNKAWGYHFDGKGGMEKLTGTLVFRPVTLRKCPAPKKGLTTKVTQKVTKRAPKANKGRLRLTCVACREQGHVGTVIRGKSCPRCKSDEHLKKIRV